MTSKDSSGALSKNPGGAEYESPGGKSKNPGGRKGSSAPRIWTLCSELQQLFINDSTGSVEFPQHNQFLELNASVSRVCCLWGIPLFLRV